MIILLRSYLYLTLCVVIWGSSFIVAKLLVHDYSPAMLTMLRLLFIVIFLIILGMFHRQRKRPVLKKDYLLIGILGVVGVFLNQWTLFVGLETADTTSSALILALTPIVAGFLAVIFLKEKINVRMVVGFLIAIVGIFYVVTKGSLAAIHIDKGIYWILLTMTTFAIMIVITRSLSARVDPFTITLYTNVIAFTISIPFVYLLDGDIVVSTKVNSWMLLIISAIIIHGIATLIWNNHIRNVDATKASILSNLEPFVAMVVGFIVLAKPITAIELFGSLLIVSGVVLSTYQKPNKKLSEEI